MGDTTSKEITINIPGVSEDFKLLVLVDYRGVDMMTTEAVKAAQKTAGSWIQSLEEHVLGMIRGFTQLDSGKLDVRFGAFEDNKQVHVAGKRPKPAVIAHRSNHPESLYVANSNIMFMEKNGIVFKFFYEIGP